MLVVFALDRFRIEIVAMTGLALGFALGLVPGARVFDGFSNPAVVTVVEILLIVQVLARARLLDTIARRIAAAGLGETPLILGLCAASAAISVFMNNIGALALMLPVIATIAAVGRLDPRKMLIPVSYSTLLGGMGSLIGTPANLLVSQALVAAGGRPFGFFDFATAGIPITMAGVLVIVLWIPRRFDGEAATAMEAFAGRVVVAEVTVPKGSPLIGLALPKLGGFGLACHGTVRSGKRVFGRPGAVVVADGDLLIVSADLAALDRLAAADIVAPAAGNPPAASRAELVVMPESTLVGSRIAAIEAFPSRGLRVVALSTRTTRVEGRLHDLQLSIGDILVIEGEPATIAEAAEETETLQLTPRARPSAPLLRSWLPPAAFAAGVVLAAAGLLTPELAFGLVLLVLALSGHLRLRSALADLNWPIILMLGAMIPLGTAVETTGAAAALAANLLALLPVHMPWVLLTAAVLLGVVVTPFVNNATTAIVLAPIVIAVARAAGLPAEPMLIAVAVGASTDFLTPFGHHNNTLVMTIGGYRFSDFIRCGWPVTLASIVVGSLALSLIWLGGSPS
ncbi:MAG: SLC13 family permease [Pararhizobium sp.]